MGRRSLRLGMTSTKKQRPKTTKQKKKDVLKQERNVDNLSFGTITLETVKETDGSILVKSIIENVVQIRKLKPRRPVESSTIRSTEKSLN